MCIRGDNQIDTKRSVLKASVGAKTGVVTVDWFPEEGRAFEADQLTLTLCASWSLDCPFEYGASWRTAVRRHAGANGESMAREHLQYGKLVPAPPQCASSSKCIYVRRGL